MLSYHRIIQQGIDEFARFHVGRKVSSISKGGERLKISHRTKDLPPITFKPDRVLTLKDRTKVAFQILGSQAGKEREIEADILRAYLCIEISKLVFITPTPKDYKNVKRISDIIRDVFEALGAQDDFLTIIVRIPKDIKRPKTVADYLSDPGIVRELFSS